MSVFEHHNEVCDSRTEWDDPFLPQDARRNREVFARYGLAMHNAQCLEKQIGILLVLAEPNIFELDAVKRESLFDVALSKTFGKAWTRLQKTVPFGEDVIQRVARAREIRNELAHNYFWLHAADLLSETGKERMIGELTVYADELSAVEKDLTMLSDCFMLRCGVTEEAIERALLDLVREASN